MLIVHVTTTDPAGAVYNLARAVNEHTPHRARVITTAYVNGFQFPRDIFELYDGGEEIDALLRDADVIHFHKITEEFSFDFENSGGARREFKIANYITEGKRVVYQIHGHPSERANVKEMAEMYAEKKRPVLIVSPVLAQEYRPILGDLLRWSPNCVPVNDVKYLPRQTDALHTVTYPERPPEKKYMVIQTPTDTVIKSTHVIREAVENVGKDLPVFFYQVGPMPIATQETTLKMMRASHIVFDNLGGNAGLASLQGLSMAKPVIAGLADCTLDAISDYFGVSRDRIPWWIAKTQSEVEGGVRTLLQDSVRRHFGEESRKFMENVWSDKNVAQRLADFYSAL